MDIFRFLKEMVGLGNGDLILLLAFKKDWKLKIRDCMENLGLQHAHAWKILEVFNAHGFCKKVTVRKKGRNDNGKGREISLYIFNNEAVKMVERIFERKILPKVPITPEDFLKKDEVYLVME